MRYFGDCTIFKHMYSTLLTLCISVLAAGNPEPADQLEGPRSDWLRRAGSWRNISSAASQKRENSLPVWQASAHYQETRRNLHIQGAHPGQLCYSKHDMSQRDTRHTNIFCSLTVFLTWLPTCPLQCCNLMLVEVIPKEPLSFSVFHYKNPKLQHTVQVHCIKRRCECNCMFGLNHADTSSVEQESNQKVLLFIRLFAGVWLFCRASRFSSLNCSDTLSV